jgi:lipoprotein-anchoring transpeptidase ErfK/SrfK
MSTILTRMAFAVILGLATLSFSAPASAQLWEWDWGGEEKVDGTGSAVVKFDVKQKPGQIFVSYADKRLYFVTKPGEALAYPIAIPRQQDLWEGTMVVSDKKVNPSWTPTPDMIKENPRLPRWVPGGHPMNPLGVRAMYLGSSAYRIHGTDAPWTIGQPVSKGCIRMFNKDVIELYEKVPVGTKVTVTWQQFVASS